MMDKKLWKQSTEEQLAKVGTSEHLTLEELVEYFFVHKGFDEYFVRESARVNSHVMKCADCRKLWEPMRLVSAAGEVYTYIMEAVSNLDASTDQSEREQLLDYIQSKVEYYDTVVLFHNLESDKQTI